MSTASSPQTRKEQEYETKGVRLPVEFSERVARAAAAVDLTFSDLVRAGLLRVVVEVEETGKLVLG